MCHVRFFFFLHLFRQEISKVFIRWHKLKQYNLFFTRSLKEKYLMLISLPLPQVTWFLATQILLDCRQTLRWRCQFNTYFFKQAINPKNFLGGVTHNYIFCLCSGQGCCRLFLSWPWDRSTYKQHCVPIVRFVVVLLTPQSASK